MAIHIYTDGSSRPEGEKEHHWGGWGVCVYKVRSKNPKRHDLITKASGFKVNTDNVRMEIKAMRHALQYMINECLHLSRTEPIVLHSDFKPMVDMINRLTDFESDEALSRPINTIPFKFRRLIEESVKAKLQYPNIEFKWVKSHSGIYGNEQADRLASDASRRIRDWHKEDEKEVIKPAINM